MTAARFTGFGPAATDWFVALDSDNSRAYWTATKDIWLRDVRGPLEALLGELADGFGGGVKLFRPHRDVRFSHDPSPLKRGAGGLLTGLPGAASRYLEISAEGLYAGTGIYRFERDQLDRFRRAAAAAAGAVLAGALDAVVASGLELGGEVLRGAPQGYRRDHPRIDLLRRKGLYLGSTMPPGDALETRAPVEHARRTWAAAAAVSGWLDTHVGPSEMAAEDRSRRRRTRG